MKGCSRGRSRVRHPTIVRNALNAPVIVPTAAPAGPSPKTPELRVTPTDHHGRYRGSANPAHNRRPDAHGVVGAILLAVGALLAVVMYSSLPGIFLVLAGLFLLRRAGGPKPTRDDGRLPSRPSGGQVLGGFMSQLEHLATGQARAVPQIEVQYRQRWASLNGVTANGLDEPIERPQHPDRSRARV